MRGAFGARRLSGYAIRFRELSADLGGFRERIDPGAWDPATGGVDVVATFNHSVDNVLGRLSAGTLRLFKDAQGIRYEIDVPDTTTGRDVAELVRRKDVAGSSFTFRINRGGQEHAGTDPESGLPVRVITSMTVTELGPVLNPAYPTTTVDTRSRSLSDATKEPNLSDALNQYVSLTDSPTGRRVDDFTVLGMSNSLTRESEWVDTTDVEPAPIVLSAAGSGSRLINAVTVFPFRRQHGYIPIAPKLTAGLQARNETAQFLENQIKAPDFRAVKVSAAVAVDRDTIVDIASAEGALSASLAAAVGQRVDHVLINGGTDGDVTVVGMLGEGVTTTVGALDFGGLADAVARVADSGGNASAVIARPAVIASILKSVDGGKLDRLPALIAVPDLADGTVSVPAGTVIVADLSAVAVAMRERVEVFRSTHEAEAFARDLVFLAGRSRVSGVVLADKARVQILKTDG